MSVFGQFECECLLQSAAMCMVDFSLLSLLIKTYCVNYTQADMQISTILSSLAGAWLQRNSPLQIFPWFYMPTIVQITLKLCMLVLNNLS